MGRADNPSCTARQRTAGSQQGRGRNIERGLADRHLRIMLEYFWPTTETRPDGSKIMGPAYTAHCIIGSGIQCILHWRELTDLDSIPILLLDSGLDSVLWGSKFIFFGPTFWQVHSSIQSLIHGSRFMMHPAKFWNGSIKPHCWASSRRTSWLQLWHVLFPGPQGCYCLPMNAYQVPFCKRRSCASRGATDKGPCIEQSRPIRARLRPKLTIL